MRRLVWLLLIAVLVIAATWWLTGLPGQVVLRVGDMTIATRTPLALVAAVLLVLLVYGVLRLVAGVIGLPRRLGRWRSARNRVNGDHATNRALVALAAGDAPTARKEAARALRWLGETPQTLLHAAEAVRLAGREDIAAGYFRKLAAHPEGAFLGLRGLFRQSMAREEWDEAALLAAQAEAKQPGTGWLRDTRLMLAARQQNWQQAAALAEPGPVHAALAIAASGSVTSKDEALRLAKQGWTEAKDLAPAALAYADGLRAAGQERKAIEVLRETWALAQHPDLVSFVVAPGADDAARLKLFTDFVQPRAAGPEAQLALARLSLAAGAIGDATYHLEAAEHAGLTDRRIGVMRADLARATGQPEAERAALRAAAEAMPAPGWVCHACGTGQAEWYAVCTNCRAVGRIVWGRASGGTPRLALTT